MLARYLESVTWNVSDPRRLALGTYRGLRFGLILHPQFPPEVYLQGTATLQDTLSRDHHGPRAIFNALERLAGSYATHCASLRKDLDIAEAQLRDYKARLGAPFTHDSYFSELTSLRDQLKAGLARPAATGEDDPQPSVSELAERIKTLKAAHTIEGTPERIGERRTVAAEEPVTARIRRRTSATPAQEPTEPELATPAPRRPAEVLPLPGHFRQQLAEERLADEEPRVKQLSLW
jgi:hypothetical protein